MFGVNDVYDVIVRVGIDPAYMRWNAPHGPETFELICVSIRESQGRDKL